MTTTYPKSKILLIDGSSYLYRAYYALPNLRLDSKDPTSQPTGAIRGMINMLQLAKKDYAVEYAVCVFDAKGSTFREHIYPAYKANRPSMPVDLRAQIEPIHRVVKLLGFPLICVEGVEADDVIGTLAKLASQQGMEVIIASGDKDLCQLVNPQVKLIDSMKNKVRDEQGVRAEFGISPQQMIDYQTLVGDSVDNVPGVAKVGPKTAVKWLQEYGSLANLLANIDSIKGAVGNNLRASLAWLPTAAQLVTIKTDCDLAQYIASWPELTALKLLASNDLELKNFYLQYGFQSLLVRLEQVAQAVPASVVKTSQPEANTSQLDLFSKIANTAPAAALSKSSKFFDYQCVTTWPQFELWLARIKQSKLTAIDTETTSLQPLQARLVGLSLAVAEGQAAYIPLAHDYTEAPPQLPIDEVLSKLRPWLENANYAKVGQNIKYDLHVFANHKINALGYVHDTMLESYVLEADMPHNLANMAVRHLGRSSIKYEDICGKGAQQICFSKVSLEQATNYAAEDAEQCLALHNKLWPIIEQSAKLSRIYQLEINCSKVLLQMERNGVLIDSAELARQSLALQQKIDACTLEAYSLAGEEFNLNSPKQIGEIFYQKLGYPVVKKTASGAASTNEEVLEKLALDYPLPATILKHRGFFKLKSTYTDKLGSLVNPQTKRVHTNYAQAVAVTGRLSSLEPNLQNIPIRTAEGRAVRQAFVAPKTRLIASADYSQIELRIMAHLSQDETLLAAFAAGQDIHRATAAEIFSLPLEAINTEQRRLAKVINFGLIYGMGAHGLARNLGINHQMAKNYITTYFQRYPGVKAYMDETRAVAKEQGYVETVFGRRLMLPEINSTQAMRRAGAERAAINAPMQGTAADLIKLSMIEVQKVLNQEKPTILLIMQVHDELVFELAETDVAWLKERVPDIMNSVAQLSVPLVTELGIGNNWQQAH